MHRAASLTMAALVALGVAGWTVPDLAAHRALGGSASAAVPAPTTTRVSVASDGDQARRGAFLNSISADGRYVLFHSQSPGLVRGDGPDWDAFVRDRSRETTRLVSMRAGLPG